jgi:hypothetical protein
VKSLKSDWYALRGRALSEMIRYLPALSERTISVFCWGTAKNVTNDKLDLIGIGAAVTHRPYADQTPLDPAIRAGERADDSSRQADFPIRVRVSLSVAFSALSQSFQDRWAELTITDNSKTCIVRDMG